MADSKFQLERLKLSSVLSILSGFDYTPRERERPLGVYGGPKFKMNFVRDTPNGGIIFCFVFYYLMKSEEHS
jgi:hypothetical protein